MPLRAVNCSRDPSNLFRNAVSESAAFIALLSTQIDLSNRRESRDFCRVSTSLLSQFEPLAGRLSIVLQVTAADAFVRYGEKIHAGGRKVIGVSGQRSGINFM